MMLRPLATIIYLIFIAANSSDAKIINAEASSSYFAKVTAGLAQSAESISNYAAK